MISITTFLSFILRGFLLGSDDPSVRVSSKLCMSAPQAPKNGIWGDVVRSGGRGPGDPPGRGSDLKKSGKSTNFMFFPGRDPYAGI